MKKYLLLVLIVSTLTIGCNSGQSNSNKDVTGQIEVLSESSEPCPNSWDFSKPIQGASHLEAIVINDSVTQQVLLGKVWFEIVSPQEIGKGRTRSYLKFYRTDGTLEEEGYGVYYEHPVADFSYDGLWKFYNCNGSLKEEVEYEDGQPKNN